MPPQPVATSPATASTAAANTRIPASYRGRGPGARGGSGSGIRDWGLGISGIGNRDRGLESSELEKILSAGVTGSACALGWRWARRVEQAQPRDHQAIGLARERGREDRVAFGVAREFLRERNQVLPLERRSRRFELHLESMMIAQSDVIGNLYYDLRSTDVDFAILDYPTALHSMRRSTRILVVLAIVSAFGLAFVLTPPRGPRSLRQFDADRLAALEVRMWQAYYAKERPRLFLLLVTLLHEQYRYPWATAAVRGIPPGAGGGDLRRSARELRRGAAGSRGRVQKGSIVDRRRLRSARGRAGRARVVGSAPRSPAGTARSRSGS